MNDKHSFAYKCGQIAGAVLYTCITACAVSIILALTLKFIFWIF
jgi:hypothetical protein